MNNKSILFILFIGLTSCGDNDISPNIEPADIEYGAVILNLQLPDQLIDKITNNESAEYVFDQWSTVQNTVKEQTEMINNIKYEIEISAVLDTTNGLGVNWLPFYAKSKEFDGYIWQNNNYQSTFYQSETSAVLVEFGMDDEYQYILWYSLFSDFWGAEPTHIKVFELKQSLDGKTGSSTNRKLLDGVYVEDMAMKWSVRDNTLELENLTSDFSMNWSLGLNGNGLIENLGDCTDRYFWDSSGNGVHESRSLGTRQQCQTVIERW